MFENSIEKTQTWCTYPNCNCPFDAPADPNWCARGLPKVANAAARASTSDGRVSDGSTASYYELPAGATELQHLISHRDMNAQIGEIFRAAYRYGQASHSNKLRDAKKIKFYAEAEIARLEKLK